MDNIRARSIVLDAILFVECLIHERTDATLCQGSFLLTQSEKDRASTLALELQSLFEFLKP